jgi:sugar/nucleoside kinase (ribokinase family)
MFDGEAVVAGHICLDVIPTFVMETHQALLPGALVTVGPARFSPGGAVSNVGLALLRLGCRPHLVGRIGDDRFGETLLALLREHDAHMAEGVRVLAGETTSYSIVINPPGVDRTFLHCSGANDRFGAEDVSLDWAGVRLFHFGYPPLMEHISAHDGVELAALLAGARAQGVATSLDMARPDPESAMGHVDWAALLRHCLPQVDLFMPSAEELVFMLDRPRIQQPWHLAQIESLAERCLELGAAIVLVKLGDQGLLLRSTDDAARLAAAGEALTGGNDRWRGRHLWAPCFAVRVAGTTGAGDATIAGFLLALLAGMDPVAALTHAVAVGACSVEAPDATSGIPAWETVEARIAVGWERLPLRETPPNWRWEAAPGIWYGPNDQEGAWK